MTVAVGARGDEMEGMVATEASSMLVTSASFARREPTSRWSPAETLQFYRALRECGTDFGMVAQLFPTRSRRQVKRKFKKEEKERPTLVDAALFSSAPLELDRYLAPLTHVPTPRSTVRPTALAVPAPPEGSAAGSGAVSGSSAARAEVAATITVPVGSSACGGRGASEEV
jgi:hypothetical protein